MGSPLKIGAAALAAVALAAPAAEAADRPRPCQGSPILTDPAGDAFIGVGPVGESPREAGPNTDLTGLFINNRGGRHTVNITIADLTTAVPTDATGVSYRMTYKLGDASNFLRAVISSEGTVTYTYGRGDSEDGDTTGALFEGKDGVISVTLPSSHAGRMTDVVVASSYVRARADTPTDRMPDGEGSGTYDDALCPTNTSMPVSSNGTPPPASITEDPSQTAALSVRARPNKLKLKKLRRARKLSLTLTSSEPLEDISISLQKGKKVVGAAKRDLLDGSEKVTLKLRKRLKRGAYRLVVTGRRDDGSTGSVLLKLSAR